MAGATKNIKSFSSICLFDVQVNLFIAVCYEVFMVLFIGNNSLHAMKYLLLYFKGINYL